MMYLFSRYYNFIYFLTLQVALAMLADAGHTRLQTFLCFGWFLHG